MGSVTRTLFGGGKTKSEATPITFPRLPAVRPTLRTGAGSLLTTDLTFGRQGEGQPFGLTGVDVRADLAPEIAQIREEVLGGRRGLLTDVQGDIQTLRGLENPFIQARVQPFIEERERARRGAIRRGVAGPLTALATNPFTARIAEAGALATAEAQEFIRRGQETIRGLLTDISGEGRALLEQELELLGLTQQEIRDIIASQFEQTIATQQRERTTRQGAIFGTIGLPALG